MRRLLAITAVLVFAPALFASDAERAVLKAAYDSASRAAAARGGAPTIVCAKTTGGAETFASQWAVNISGKAVGEELGNSYKSANNEPAVVKDLLPDLKDTIDMSAPYDWRRIDKFEPGHNSLIVFSRPAFDSNNTIAMVRVDVIPHEGTPTTTFYELEHQPDNTWRVNRAAMSQYDAVRRTDIKLQ